MHRSRIVLGIVVATVIAGCPGPQNLATPPQTPPAPVAKKPRVKEPVAVRASKTGLGFRLSEGDDNGDDDGAQPAATVPLTPAETNALFSRLPKLQGEADDVKEFALRAKSIPAPRPGDTIKEAFPPPFSAGPPPAVVTGALKVSRHEPDGDVPLAPHLTVTFNAPMVPITSHDDLAKFPVPIKLTPEPPGKWRWLGTQTAMFQPDRRFPMSTDYTVDIDAGTKSVLGSTLAEAQHYKFSTPTMKVTGYGPSYGAVKLDPLIWATFDQAIDPQALLAAIVVKQNGQAIKVRLATQAEMDGDDEIVRLMERRIDDGPLSLGVGDYKRSAGGQYAGNAAKGRLFVVTPEQKLQTAAAIDVRFPRGTSSAEGPKKTEADQGWSFSTYSPLQIISHSCGDCTPFDTLDIELNNPLDLSKFDKALVSVAPAIPDLKLAFNGNYISISGRKKGRTKYTVKVAAAVTDIFKQTLGKEETMTFTVGSAPPVLFREEEGIVVLDPASNYPKLPIYSVNDPTLHVRLYSVKPELYASYEQWRDAWNYDGKNTPPPGTLVLDRIVHPAARADELVETDIDLRPMLTGGFGQILAVVETTRPFRERWQKEWVRQWIQVTHLGVSAVTDSRDLVAWATNLADGTPIEGASVLAGPGTGKSGADGIAKLAAVTSDRLIVTKGHDLTFIPGGVRMYGYRPHPLHFFTFDDRKMYKPGEPVHVKGWARDISYDKGGDVTIPSGAATRKVHWVAHDPRGAELDKGDAPMDASGGFDFVVKTPDNANLGQASVSLEAGGSGTHTFQIQEFRRPEFEVNASTDGGPYFVGEHGVATIAAKYYSGGGLPNAEVSWTVTRSEGFFQPPNRDEYIFGRHEYESSWPPPAPGKKQPPTTETWKGHTNATGEHHLRIDYDALDPAYPMSLALNASVMDVNRQAWAAGTTMLVHPSSLYVGLKLDKYFVNAGEAINVDVIATDLDGKLASGKNVSVRATRIDWDQTAAGYVEKEVDEQTCSVTTGESPVRCTLPTKSGGRYRLVAKVEDEYKRKSQTAMSMWVMDKDSPPSRELQEDVAQVIPDKKEYKAGETAQLLVVAPFTPAEGVLVLARQGIVSTERFTMTSRMQTLKVKMDGNLTPNVNAQVLLVGSATRLDDTGSPNEKLPKRPAHASGSASLSLPPLERTLKIAVSPRDKELEPAGRTMIDVNVNDARGNPVAGSSVAVWVVDESILALSAYTRPDPIATFYPARDADTSSSGTRELVTLAKPGDTELADAAHQAAELRRERMGPVSLAARAPGGGFGGLSGMGSGGAMAPAASAAMDDIAPRHAGAPPPPPPAPKKAPSANEKDKGAPAEPMATTAIAVRTDFSALAIWEAKRETDARGHIEIPVKLPDSLTRYRVMAVAVAHDNEFGSAESTITARLPLQVRPSAPRFLNFGDVFELPVVLQNQTDKEVNAAVAVRATNASIRETPGKRVLIPPHDRVEVRFSAAAEKPGKARFQVGAGSGNFADAANIELPVWTPATTEAFATYGVIDNGAIAQPVKFPDHVVKEYGGLEVTTSSTAMQGLTDAVLYLIHYPFECNEQISSRMLAIESLRDVLAAFKNKELPTDDEMKTSMAEDMAKLKTRQKYDGGFGFWWGEEWPYLSVHVAHALARAEEKGYKVDASVKARSLSYLQSIEGHIPYFYTAETRRAIIAYALYVRRLWKNPDAARAKRLITEAGGVDKVEITTLGWIWPTLSEDKNSQSENNAIRRHIGNRIEETAGAAHFVTSYGDGDYLLLHSDRRADGVLLEAMIVDQPDSDVIPKLVKGLLAHRKAGRWTSTQENAFVLLGLDKYFRKYEGVTPDFVARVWLGDKLAGEHTFKGRSTDYSEIDVPMQFLADIKEGNLTVAKDGPGRLYFRLGMQYAPEDLRPPPMDQGFTVLRTYESVDDDGDVKKDAQGVWHFKAGKKVRGRVTMVAPSRRYHVALVDPIPAGIEPMNPALAVTGVIPQDPNAEKNADRYWYWQSTWYEHQNMRDERVEAFASLVWEGVHEYVYTARATTPGTFAVPPPKAEEMYSPEVFGRGAGDKVIVE